ncbi:hypothetical protein VTL71DRAFT_16338 [Oculimacula yallundae]|uniref:Uncharacterized protein n=1 Tax=Oculimacula yallundae TaxID=86028 RepID=A0ABR4CE72_9HELO
MCEYILRRRVGASHNSTSHHNPRSAKRTKKTDVEPCRKDNGLSDDRDQKAGAKDNETPSMQSDQINVANDESGC